MKKWLEKIGYRMASFMYGRYGNDELTNFLLISALILMVISWIPRLGWVYLLAIVLLSWSLMRSFSRKFERRHRERDCYLRLRKPIFDFFKLSKNKWRDHKRIFILSVKNARRFFACLREKAPLSLFARVAKIELKRKHN